MQVTLINYTPSARELLIFTKSTRLNMAPGLLAEIHAMSNEAKEKELAYMAETIPSSWEFVDYVFLVQGVSRAYTHQQVRTRSASYAQQSLRVVDARDFEYIFTERNLANPLAKGMLDACLGTIRATYNALVAAGQPAEDARGILPTNIATNIVCKFNLRTFVDLAKSREGGRTQGEYRQVIGAMIDEVLRVHPWADKFIYHGRGRDYFAEIEAFAEERFGGDLAAKGQLLKIVDKMRKGAT
jgi:flavin-dependent thymidylate synthase